METDKPTKIIPFVEQETPQHPVQINYWGRSVDMYYVQDSELENIGTANNESSLYMAFCGIAIGLFLALVGILLQVDIPNAKVYATCWLLMLGSGIGSILLGIKAVISHLSSKNQINRIRQQSKPNK